MSRTMWLAVFCLVGVGASIAIKATAPPAEHAQGQSKMEPAFALNESAKSDRLELPNTPVETEIIVPATETRPVETPPASPETTGKIASRHWQDANAKTIPVAPPRRHTKSKESKKVAGEYPLNARAEVWHCRQDAVGSLLRSLDLSPRCNL